MKPLVLIILDGFGIRHQSEGNATLLADSPNLKRYWKDYPRTELEASGEAVGLPKGVMGNSEVGHLTIGSGRIIYQGLSRINHAIQDGIFFENKSLKDAFLIAKKNNSTVHLMGLLSDGGVHSHQTHLVALLEMSKKLGAPKVAVHAFLDGRDTSPQSSIRYVQELQESMKGFGEIATIVGRYYAMDRDKRWERVQIAYEALVEGKGEVRDDPAKAVEEAYAQHVTDEFIKPFVFSSKTFSNNRINDGDTVIFFNFRPDRAREITAALTDPNFSGFERKKFPKIVSFVCMAQYDKNFALPVAFPPVVPNNTLAEILSQHGIKQFHTAETEKYAHVTYFLNGGVEPPFPGEERLLIPSPKEVPTYDLKPEMSAEGVTKAALEKLKEGCPVIFMNYANPDMVGHSGKLPATIKAVEVIDQCVGKIVDQVLKQNGTVLITADHGNCEQMLDEQGGPHTAHTTNPVPLLLISDQMKNVKLKSGKGLQDVAPTILKILNLPQPKEITGESVLNG